MGAPGATELPAEDEAAAGLLGTTATVGVALQPATIEATSTTVAIAAPHSVK